MWFVWYLETGTCDFLLRENLSRNFLLRLGLASYLCCLLLRLFLFTKRHPSDVKPSHLPIFSLIQSAVYPVSVSKDCFCFTIITLIQIFTKVDTNNCFWMPYKCTKFQLDWSMSLRVIAIFSSVWKDEERKKKRRKKLKSLLSHILEMFPWFSSNLVCCLPW